MKNTINTALSSTILIAAGTLFTNTASADVINLKDYSSTGTIEVLSWNENVRTINLEGDSLTQNIKMYNVAYHSYNTLKISAENPEATISGNISLCGWGRNYLDLNGGASFDFTGNITVSTLNESTYGECSHHVIVNLNSAATQNFSGVISSQYPSSPKHFMCFSSANDAAAVNHTVNISNINNTFDGCYVLDAGELSGSVVNDRKTTLEVSNNAIKDATVLLTENTVLKITEAGTQVSRITGTTGEINIAENASLSGGLNVLNGKIRKEYSADSGWYEDASYGVVQYSEYKSSDGNRTFLFEYLNEKNTALTKTGAGTLTLDKLCREFTGTINVAEGTLAIAHGKALADGKVNVAENATLSVEVTIGGGSIVLSEGAKLFLSNNLFTPSSMDGSNDEWYSIWTETPSTGGSQDGDDNDGSLGGFVVLSLGGGDEGESGESEAIVLDVMTADASLSCGGTDINNETLALLDAYTVYDSGFDAYTKTWQISNDGTLQLALTPAVTMAAYSDDPSPVPEPSAFGLLSGLGAIAVNCARRRRLVK